MAIEIVDLPDLPIENGDVPYIYIYVYWLVVEPYPSEK